MNNKCESYKYIEDSFSGAEVKKEEKNEFKIVREYNNRFSCDELIRRIIKYHQEEDFKEYKTKLKSMAKPNNGQ